MWLAGAAVLLAATSLLAYVLLRPHDIAPPKPMAASSARPAGVSIAVLPFLNLSADKDQEFFSDGMTEEITSALAKVPGLAVIGRTSAFQFKGENRDLRAIGRALGVNNLIEGSVRKEGDEVRITAQLIRAGDGTHLWTESYDRKLKSIFAVQENIASAIAGALQVPLGLKQGESLVSSRTEDTASYQDYLRAVALGRARKIDETVKLLNAVLARDPGYAPAWAALAQAYTAPVSFARFEKAIAAGSTGEARRIVQAQYALIERAARKAVALDPRSAVAYNALGSLEALRGNWAKGEDYHRRALALDPNSPEVLYSYSYLLAATGRLKQAMPLQTQLMALEPFVPVFRSRMADVLWALGQNDAAVKIFQSMNRESRDLTRLAKVYATEGRYAQAADTLLAVVPDPEYSREPLEVAAGLLRAAPAKVADPAALPLLPGNLSFVYLFIGADSRSLDFSERAMDAGYYGSMFRDPWSPPSAALRRTERFKDFARKARFVEYWRARGWPDYCHPVGADDFACQ